MPSKADLKIAASLKSKKGRTDNGLFAVEGAKMIQEAISSGWVIRALYVTANAAHEFTGHDVQVVSMAEMEKITSLSNPSPCLAVVESREYPKEAFKGTGNWVWLDDLSDPGNVGTIIRTADWFGFKGIICGENTVELYNPKVVQATMGSVFRMPVIYAETGEMISLIRKFSCRLIGADMSGESLQTFEFSPTDILVIGNESRGISNVLESALDAKVTIPGRGGAESLNASVAAGIIISRLSLL